MTVTLPMRRIASIGGAVGRRGRSIFVGPAWRGRAAPASGATAPEQPRIAPGQLWYIELPAGEIRLLPAECAAVAAADAVIYDHALAALVTAHRPPGGYAEPDGGEGSTERCLQLARDGWRVVRLVAAQRPTQAHHERLTIIAIADGAEVSVHHAFVLSNGLAG
jgi:hypothetical protein